jgi:5-amino-6-(5-phosphoribosylamino)uracil reductase
MEWVQLSVAMSLDGYIDAADGDRLVLSGEADCHDMHAARAACDAILVGAGTLRRDDPRLTVRYPELLARRRDAGLPDQPAKVVLTRSCDIDPDAGFFHVGGRCIVLCPQEKVGPLRDKLADRADVVGLADEGVTAILAALRGCGIRRLFVEGGSQVLTQFLAAGAFHQLRLAIAPFLLGQAGAPRLAGPADFLHGPDHRLRLLSMRNLDNVAVLDLANDTPML